MRLYGSFGVVIVPYASICVLMDLYRSLCVFMGPCVLFLFVMCTYGSFKILMRHYMS